MKDFLGKELEVGDSIVACVQRYRNNYDLVKGTITKLTPKMVKFKDSVGYESKCYSYKIIKVCSESNNINE